MAKVDKVENKEAVIEKKVDKKSKKSSYSKNPNFYEIDGTLEIDQITSKINDILGV